MAEHLDLEGMSPQDARAYVMEYLAALKRTQRERDELSQEFSKWEQRVKTAAQHGREDLKEQAMNKCREIAEKHQRLAAEARDLDTDIQVLKKNLQKIERRPQHSVDANGLLQQIEQVTGPTDQAQTQEEFSNIELDEQLAALKRNVKREDEGDDR